MLFISKLQDLSNNKKQGCVTKKVKKKKIGVTPLKFTTAAPHCSKAAINLGTLAVQKCVAFRNSYNTLLEF